MSKTMILATSFFIACSGSSFAAEMWKWKTPSGSTGFGAVPPTGIDAQKIIQKDVQSIGKVKDPNIVSLEKFAAVTLYVSAGCKTACSDARALLGKQKIQFTEKDASLPEIDAEFSALSPQRTVPVLKIGDRVLIGFESNAWNNGLSAAGYTIKEASPNRTE